MALKKSELYSSLWASCDELRGGMDASQYKDYVLVLLFVKYVSDRFAGQPYAAITVPKGASFADMVALKGKTDIGDQINKKILGPLAQANQLSDALGMLIEKFLDKDINLSPHPVGDLPALDNHSMGTMFEELVRRFNEENNEEAGEHWTPRDAVRLMANLMFLPVADRIESGTYLLYDCACGTGGMLTVAEETLQQIAKSRGKQIATHLYGQEINDETYAICKADMLLKGDSDAADNIVGGSEHSTLSNDAFRGREFDFMLANPPYGKSWKADLERMGGKKDLKDPRFIIQHHAELAA